MRMRMRMRGITVLLVALVVAGATAACSPTLANNAIIDGWSIDMIGSPSCAGGCQAYVDKAKEQFDVEVPGHAAVVSATAYREGQYAQRDGRLIDLVRSGGPFTIVVLRLADGAVVALGVKPFGEGRLWALRRGPHPLDF
jgi:hypothetical protein